MLGGIFAVCLMLIPCRTAFGMDKQEQQHFQSGGTNFGCQKLSAQTKFFMSVKKYDTHLSMWTESFSVAFWLPPHLNPHCVCACACACVCVCVCVCVCRDEISHCTHTQGITQHQTVHALTCPAQTQCTGQKYGVIQCLLHSYWGM